jgi:hypothetical protein
MAFTDSEGHPYEAVKRALAEHVGGTPDEICLTSNTTSALAMAYQGLSLRGDQEVVTTEHDHYSHHESIRLAAERSGAAVRYVSLYDKAADARAEDIVARVERAIGPKTRALGVTWVHSSTGVKLPVAAIAQAVKETNRGRAARTLPAHRGRRPRVCEPGRGRRAFGLRPLRLRRPQMALRAARHRIPLGPQGRLAGAATNDPDV